MVTETVQLNTLPLTLYPSTKKNKIVVEMDADRFERLAAAFGFFNPEFLESLDQAEREIAHGKTKRLKSLQDLRS
ncbi:MAG: hypothetical protein Q8R39_02695 [bacterium]|nr:hypothetical protein [bacterium]MDZ4284512.1 hypothetical protein [Patescibacteria group bacterium]